MRKAALLAILALAAGGALWLLREGDPVREVERRMESLARALTYEEGGMIGRIAGIQAVAGFFATNASVAVAGGSREVRLEGRGEVRRAAAQARSSWSRLRVSLEPLRIEEAGEGRVRVQARATVWVEDRLERERQPLELEWAREGRRWRIRRVRNSPPGPSGRLQVPGLVPEADSGSGLASWARAASFLRLR